MDDFQYFLPDENGFRSSTLDQMLSAGYYRMQHFMFTTNSTSLGTEETVPRVLVAYNC
jgi:hypothetical protein